MIPQKYLRGLDARGPVRGVYSIPHSRRAGAWRTVSSYEDGLRYKKHMFDAMGQAESQASWDWHHVVEGQHFADVDFSGQLAQLYKQQLPCVLIAREEHLAYNMLLHIRETDELFRDTGLPADLRERSAHAALEGRVKTNHPTLRLRVANLKRQYQYAYAGDHVLITIAENVLDDVLNDLR